DGGAVATAGRADAGGIGAAISRSLRRGADRVHLRGAQFAVRAGEPGGVPAAGDRSGGGGGDDGVVVAGADGADADARARGDGGDEERGEGVRGGRAGTAAEGRRAAGVG